MAAFDIALTSLAMVQSGFKVLDLSSQAVEVSDIAYADDLVSVCASHIVLQEKADIMSVWCLTSGIKMNTSKPRTFRMSWGADRTTSEPLKIHGENWSKILVAINHDGFMTKLGVI